MPQPRVNGVFLFWVTSAMIAAVIAIAYLGRGSLALVVSCVPLIMGAGFAMIANRSGLKLQPSHLLGMGLAILMVTWLATLYE